MFKGFRVSGLGSSGSKSGLLFPLQGALFPFLKPFARMEASQTLPCKATEPAFRFVYARQRPNQQLGAPLRGPLNRFRV